MERLFGGMKIINHDYLTLINHKYDLSKLFNVITCRYNRCSFERVIACLLIKENNNQIETLLGDLHQYCPWGITYEMIDNYKHLPLIKIWTGR